MNTTGLAESARLATAAARVKLRRTQEAPSADSPQRIPVSLARRAWIIPALSARREHHPPESHAWKRAVPGSLSARKPRSIPTLSIQRSRFAGRTHLSFTPSVFISENYYRGLAFSHLT